MFAISSLTAAIVLASTGMAMSQQPKINAADQVNAAIVPAEGKGALEFWTAEQFSQAKPMPMPRVEPHDAK